MSQEPVSTVRVTVTPESQQIERGRQGVYLLSIENLSTELQTPFVSLAGLPPDWFTIDFKDERSTFPGEKRTATVVVSVPADAPLREHDFVLFVKTEKTDQVVRCSFRAEIAQLQASTPTIIANPLAQVGLESNRFVPVLPPRVTLNPQGPFKFALGQSFQQTVIAIYNRSKLIEHYTIEVNGIPKEWYGLSAREARIDPDKSAMVPLQLSARTQQDFPAGEYEFRVRVAPYRFPESFGEAAGVITVAGVNDERPQTAKVETPVEQEPVESDSARQTPSSQVQEDELLAPLANMNPAMERKTPEVSEPRAPVVSLSPAGPWQIFDQSISRGTTIIIQNQSDIADSYSIEVDQIPADWFRLYASETTIEPGESSKIRLDLSPHMILSGKPEDRRFRVNVISKSSTLASAEVFGTLSIRPSNPLKIVGTEQGVARTSQFESIGTSTPLNVGSEVVKISPRVSRPDPLRVPVEPAMTTEGSSSRARVFVALAAIVLLGSAALVLATKSGGKASVQAPQPAIVRNVSIPSTQVASLPILNVSLTAGAVGTERSGAPYTGDIRVFQAIQLGVAWNDTSTSNVLGRRLQGTYTIRGQVFQLQTQAFDRTYGMKLLEAAGYPTGNAPLLVQFNNADVRFQNWLTDQLMQAGLRVYLDANKLPSNGSELRLYETLAVSVQ